MILLTFSSLLNPLIFLDSKLTHTPCQHKIALCSPTRYQNNVSQQQHGGGKSNSSTATYWKVILFSQFLVFFMLVLFLLPVTLLWEGEPIENWPIRALIAIYISWGNKGFYWNGGWKSVVLACLSKLVKQKRNIFVSPVETLNLHQFSGKNLDLPFSAEYQRIIEDNLSSNRIVRILALLIYTIFIHRQINHPVFFRKFLLVSLYWVFMVKL